MTSVQLLTPAVLGRVIRRVKGGFRLFSRNTGKPLGPVRRSSNEVKRKDERRVKHFASKDKKGK